MTDETLKQAVLPEGRSVRLSPGRPGDRVETIRQAWGTLFLYHIARFGTRVLLSIRYDLWFINAIGIFLSRNITLDILIAHMHGSLST